MVFTYSVGAIEGANNLTSRGISPRICNKCPWVPSLGVIYLGIIILVLRIDFEKCMSTVTDQEHYFFTNCVYFLQVHLEDKANCLVNRTKNRSILFFWRFSFSLHCNPSKWVQVERNLSSHPSEGCQKMTTSLPCSPLFSPPPNASRRQKKTPP